jgi:hypothetical protein
VKQAVFARKIIFVRRAQIILPQPMNPTHEPFPSQGLHPNLHCTRARGFTALKIQCSPQYPHSFKTALVLREALVDVRHDPERRRVAADKARGHRRRRRRRRGALALGARRGGRGRDGRRAPERRGGGGRRREAELLAEVRDRVREPLVDGEARLPVEDAAREPNVRAALARVVLRRGEVADLHLLVDEATDLVRKVEDRLLVRVADVDGRGVVGIHELDEAADEVRDLLEGARLRALALNRERLALERLDDEVRDDAAVVRVHARAKRVEDARDAHLNALLLRLDVAERLRDALALVLAGARAPRVDVAPVALRLRVDFRVALDFRSGGEEKARLDALREAEHVERAHRADLDRLDRVQHLLRRRGWAREVIDLVHLEEERLDHVVLAEGKVRVACGGQRKGEEGGG